MVTNAFDCANTYGDVKVHYYRTSNGTEVIYAVIDDCTYDLMQVAVELQIKRTNRDAAMDALLMYLASGSFTHTRNMEMFADCVRLVHYS